MKHLLLVNSATAKTMEEYHFWMKMQNKVVPRKTLCVKVLRCVNMAAEYQALFLEASRN